LCECQGDVVIGRFRATKSQTFPKTSIGAGAPKENQFLADPMLPVPNSFIQGFLWDAFSYRVSWRWAEVIFGSSPKNRVIETV
jgi:hypothetical protein